MEVFNENHASHFSFFGIIFPIRLSTMKESLVTGVCLGAATGVAIDSNSNPNNTNQGALNGALIGAAIS